MTLLPRLFRAPVICLACAAPALAQPIRPVPPPRSGLNRPQAAHRIVRQFDFDKPEKFALPQYWDLAQDAFPAGVNVPDTPAERRPGFPIYNGAEQDLSVAASGAGSVRLWTRGGSTCLRLSAGVIPVFPETEYLISARIQTRALHHARAAIIGRYLDRASAPIPGTEVRSELAVTEPGQWRLIVAPLPGGFPDAAYLQIDLDILQPEQFQTAELGSHQVWPQDYSGEAWFDEVAAVQLPRVEVATPSPINIIVAPQRPTVNIVIRDLTGERLTGRFTVQDDAGAIIDLDERPLEGGRNDWSWEPRLSRFGWYRASLELSTRSRRVGGTYVDFVWLPARDIVPASGDRSRLGLIVSDLMPGQHGDLRAIVSAAGVGSVTLPVWPRQLTAESAPRAAQELAPLIAALRSGGQRIAFGLGAVPEELAGTLHVERDDPLSVFAQDQRAWAPFLIPLIDRYGQSVPRWQIGPVGSLASARPGAAGALAAAQNFLAKLVPGPTIAAPWPAELAGTGALGPGAGEIVILLPSGAPPSSLAEMAESWRSGAGPGAITLVPEPLSDSRFSRRDAAVDLVKRIVEFWRALVPGEGASLARPIDASLSLLQPWSWPTATHDQFLPRAELGVLANLADRLEGRRIVGSLNAGRGVVCYILAPASPGRTGALVVWSQGAPPNAALEAYLGDGAVRIVDLWGNATPVNPTALPGPPTGARSRPVLTHRIPISTEPIFIENADADLARFTASFRLDPDVAQSTVGEHDLAVVLQNPFHIRVDGRLSILEPGGLSTDGTPRDRTWRITPRVSTFSIGPGETARIPISASFSAVEEAGDKPFVAEVELAAQRDYAPIRLRTTFQILLESLELDLSYQASPSSTGPDLIVEAQATNHGRTASTLELSAFAPGYPRAKASIADLPPGATALRRFAFPGGAAKLHGQRISVGAQDAETQARINRSIPID